MFFFYLEEITSGNDATMDTYYSFSHPGAIHAATTRFIQSLEKTLDVRSAHYLR